jgi:hypothetical protein
MPVIHPIGWADPPDSKLIPGIADAEKAQSTTSSAPARIRDAMVKPNT